MLTAVSIPWRHRSCNIHQYTLIMIPKTIHYCWFGHNPLPPLAVKCIESWRKFLPDYEIKEWNEENFDINIIPYTAEAYKAKKYAFVSDYARFWILYHYGGLYFDTDVEVIRPMDDIIERGPFMGCESDANQSLGLGVNPGLGLGVTPGLGLYQELLNYYEKLHYLSSDGNIIEQQTIVHHTTKLLRQHGLSEVSGIQQVAGIYIYPYEYFNPTNLVTHRQHITSNTRTIHWYAATWRNKRTSFLKKALCSILPERFLLWYNKIKRRILTA